MNLIVMPVLTNQAMTERCLRTLVVQDIGGVQVLAIDNGSTDGCASWLRTLRDPIITQRYARTRSLHVVWNEALRWAFEKMRLPYVLVVNNDVELSDITYRLLVDDGGPFVTGVGVDQYTVRTPEFLHGERHVKVSHFTRQGLSVRGVVHVGANYGYEVEHYLAMGAGRVLCFEPLQSACVEFHKRYGGDSRVDLYNCGLGANTQGVAELLVARGDGQGSSFLAELNEQERPVRTQLAGIRRLDEMKIDLAPYNTLVVDVQGMELEALVGMGSMLDAFELLNIECSREPIYAGGATAQEVIDYLSTRGFVQDSPIEDHNDIMFIRRGLKLRERRRPHPDFSCFLMREHVWRTVGPFDEDFWAFCGDNSYHLRMERAGIRAVSIDVPFYHVASGTLKSVDAEQRDRICKLADADRATFERKYGFSVTGPEYAAQFKR